MKSLKRYIFCLLAALLLMSGPMLACAAGPVTVSIEDAAVRAGEPAEMVVSIANNPGVSGASFTVVCDAQGIELADIQPIAGGSFVKNLKSGSFSWLKGSNIAGEFQLVKLCFETSPEAGGQYEIGLRLTGGHEGNLTNSKSEAVAATFQSGTLTVTGAGEGSPMDAFTDLSVDAWYGEGVEFVLAEGIMEGMGEGLFAPALSTSRAMLVTMLYRLAGCPDAVGESQFDDVKPEKWYSDAVLWASEKGIVEGYGDGSFGPGQTVTREQAAVIFYRMAKAEGLDTSAVGELSDFEDGGLVSSWAREAMSWAYGCGLMEGRSETVLAPGGSLSRSESAILLWRWCTEINK